MKYHFKIIDAQANQEIFKKLSGQKLNISSEQNLMTEDVIRTNDFQELYSEIQNSDSDYLFFGSGELKNFFPYKSKIYKILDKNGKRNYKQLYIFKVNSTLKSISKAIKYISGDNDYTEDIYAIFEELTEANGLFAHGDFNNFSIIFLDKNEINIEIFKHEFIHYLEWLGRTYKKDEFESDIDNKIKEQFENKFKVDDYVVDYLLSNIEYSTLLNESYQIIYDSLKYFNSRKETIQFFFKSKFESNEFYLERLTNWEHFNLIKDKLAFKFIVLHNILNYKVTNIRNPMYGFFLKEE